MRLIINGETKDVAATTPTIKELLVLLELTAGPVAVEINREIVPRAEHGTHLVHDGDVLEIVHMVGGG